MTLMPRMKKLYLMRSIACVMTFLSFLPLVASAQFTALNSGDEVDMRSETVTYDEKTGWATAVGNVVVKKGDQVLRANKVRMNSETGDAYAEGNVVLTRGTDVWRGNRVTGNFKTQQWNVTGIRGSSAPFRILKSEKMSKAGDIYNIYNAELTTCTNQYDHCHFHVRASRLEVKPGKNLKAHNACFYLGNVPVFYMPYWYRNLNDDYGFRFRPGYDSKMGAFLLSSYYYKINDLLDGETHLDYRTTRGVGVGQDFRWHDPVNSGELTGYYVNDQKPVDDDEDPATSDIPADRYRLKLDNTANITPDDYMLTRINYLSDTDILEDFFEREYKDSVIPENYVSYTHRKDNYTGNFIVRGRLNDFYSTVNRLPELSVDFLQQPIRNSDFYYEGHTAASILQKSWAKDSDNQDYSIFRIDSQNTISRPSRFFGFLNLIPRTGYRATYFSQTIKNITNSIVSTSFVTNGTNSVVSSTTTNTTVDAIEQGSALRSVVEFGMELSFKAFKTWDEFAIPLRHVVEPYANYTFIPDLNVDASELYQFDSVDTITDAHTLRLGVRNKLQTKRNKLASDLIDVDVYTTARLKRDSGESFLDSFTFDGEITPLDNVFVDFNAVYDVDASELSSFSSRARVGDTNLWQCAAEYRYTSNDVSLMTASLNLYPSKEWAYNVYGRHNMQDSRLEEVGGYMQRNLDCLAVRAGLSFLPGFERDDGSTRDDEVKFMFQFWLTAFPKMGLGNE